MTFAAPPIKGLLADVGQQRYASFGYVLVQQFGGLIGIAITAGGENLPMLTIIDTSTARERQLDSEVSLDSIIDGADEI